MPAPLDRLRPVVRRSAELAPTDGPDTYLRRPFGMLLVEAIMIIDAYAPRLVTRADVAEWGSEPEELFRQARANLADEARNFVMEPSAYGSGVVRNVLPADNATTWATDPAFVHSMMPPHPSRPGPDEPLVFLPEPATMLIARGSNLAEIWAALHVAREIYAASAHPLAPCAFEFTADGLLEPWAPGADIAPELDDVARRSRAEFVRDCYAQVCDDFAATPESRRFVKAQRWSMPRPELFDPTTPGVVVRQATWQPAKIQLAPAYAAVRFVPNKAEPVTAGLADIATRAPELVGGFLLDPSWVVLASFPTPEQLDRLRG